MRAADKAQHFFQQAIRCFFKLDVGPIQQLFHATPQELLRRQARLLGPQPQLGGSLIG
jgi:hypothetical protein